MHIYVITTNVLCWSRFSSNSITFMTMSPTLCWVRHWWKELKFDTHRERERHKHLHTECIYTYIQQMYLCWSRFSSNSITFMTMSPTLCWVRHWWKELKFENAKNMYTMLMTRSMDFFASWCMHVYIYVCMWAQHMLLCPWLFWIRDVCIYVCMCMWYVVAYKNTKKYEEIFAILMSRFTSSSPSTPKRCEYMYKNVQKQGSDEHGMRSWKSWN